MSESRIPDDVITHLQDEFLNKTITVEGKSGKHIGKCTFIGYNQFFPGWRLQVTLDRFPVIQVKLSSIKIVKQQ